MARFRYSALAADGKRLSGVMEGADPRAIGDRLAADGVQPLHIRPAGSGWLAWRGMRKISRDELAAFLHDLAALHHAGVPLRKAFAVLAASGPGSVAEVAGLMGDRLERGSDPASAARLDASGEFAVTAELMRAGEMSGRLSQTLGFAAAMLERRSRIARQLVTALAYPAFLLVLSGFALVALAVFAGPALEPLIAERPEGAGALAGFLSIGHFLRAHGTTIALLTAGCVLAGSLTMRAPGAVHALAALRRRAPFIGAVVRDLNFGSFAITLGALLSGGASTARALDIAARTAPNASWRKTFSLSAQALREGRGVRDALAGLPDAPPSLLRLAKVGEETGALGQMLDRAGNMLIERATRRLQRAAAALGPALILLMGGLIGWIISGFLGGLSQLGETGL
jgi:type II secretory pathway component PulF